MAAETYHAHVLVLRKTKLGETDLVLTMLDSDGCQVRAVAKGARKPNSSFAARLDIFCEADVLLVRGKSLDIVKEAKLTCAHAGVRADMEHAAACAPMVDLLAQLTQPDLHAPRLFELASSALSHAEGAAPAQAVAMCAAFILKAFAFSGLRPALDRCVMCGKPLGTFENRQLVNFSPAEGGATCNECLLFAKSSQVASEDLAWAHWLLMSTFDQIAEQNVPLRITFEVLRICQDWGGEHLGSKLKSLNFLFTCGLF